jgi:copper(I)-binding protein
MRLAVLAAAAMLSAGPAWAQPATVAVTQAWSRATTGAGTTAAIYVTVTASQPDRLTSVSTPVATMAEVHRSIMEHGVMEMRPAPGGGLDVTPGTPIRMAPGGYHIMLMGLKQPLKEGEHIPVTLTFAHAGAITTDATVAGPGASQPPRAAAAK